MSEETETPFFKRIAESAGEAIGKGIVKAIVGLLLAAGLLGGSSFINHRDARQTAHDTLWSEGGSHFYDLMTNQWALEKRIAALENELPKAQSEPRTELASKVMARDGTNYIGVYLGMIAEHDGNGGVMMYSATSGQCLRWIPYADFRDEYVLKTKPEYPNKP